MATGSLTLAMLVLAMGAPPSDVVPMNTKYFKIPIQVGEGQRDKIKELILFASIDQGITWNEVAVVKPDQDAFKFYAPADGLYWFNICLVDVQGKRQPPDIYKIPPRQKILVDTLNPGVRMVSVDRQGDEISVKWEVHEDHPDLSTLKLEYRTPDAPSWMWYTAPIQATPTGQTSFRFINAGPVSLRLQMMDVAGNVGMDQKELPAKVVTAAAPALGSAGGAGPQLPPASATPVAPAPAASTLPPSDMSGTAVAATPSSFAGPTVQPPPPAPPTKDLAGSSWEHLPPVQQTALTQPDRRGSAERPWGPPAGAGTAPASSNAAASDSRLDANAVSPGVPAAQPIRPASSRWPGGPLIPLQLTNSTQVTLDYELTKVGPSGVGRVALYLTKDEGRTWELYGEDPDLKPPITANLPGEGIYGLRLVVTSRAGLGGKPPQPGDLPQMRVEVDTTPPAVKLNYPQPDPTRRDSLVLTWSATDRSLAPNPITLQWAERVDGVWNTIATDLTNTTGRYIWQLAPNMPYRVYLRVMARDTAGNVGMDESPEPVLIDLHEPEGQLLGISGAVRRP